MVQTPLAPNHPGAPRTWKILILGNSMPITVARSSRQDVTYGEALEVQLREAGHDVSVRNAGRWFDQIDRGFHRFMERERTRFPDVLILHYGFNECRPRVVPPTLLQHVVRMRFHTYDQGVTRAGRAYRRVAAPPLWEAVRRYQRFAADKAGQRTWRMAPQRFVWEMERLVRYAREERMLVLVADINPPGPKMRHFVPGMEQRWARYQGLLRDLVAGFDDADVRLVPVSQVIDEMGVGLAVYDEMHFTPAAHRRVAEMLAAEISPWVTTQQHAPAGTPHAPSVR